MSTPNTPAPGSPEWLRKEAAAVDAAQRQQGGLAVVHHPIILEAGLRAAAERIEELEESREEWHLDLDRLRAENEALKREDADWHDRYEHVCRERLSLTTEINLKLYPEISRLRAENERLKAALDAAQDIGVYAKEVYHSDGRIERRTEWQDGWNAALEMVHGAIVDALDAAQKEGAS